MPMNIVIAPDTFKDSLSAVDVSHAMADGARRVYPDAVIKLCPMADGGEGSTQAVLAATKGDAQRVTVSGPLGEARSAQWAWLDHDTAFIELAEASGLQQLSPQQRNPMITSSYGTGQLMLAALDAGAKRLVIALGGSATNDAGAGLLQALGASLTDVAGHPLDAGGAALSSLQRLSLASLDARLGDVEIQVAVDVDNPLTGPQGASHVFAPQKGATAADVLQLDQSLSHFADVVADLSGHDHRHKPGCGAAGGAAFALHAVLNADIRSGFALMAELVNLDAHLERADLVITGEGRCDAQTLHGKTVFGVATRAQRYGVPVLVLAGALGDGYQHLYEHGVMAVLSIIDGPMSVEQSCQQAPELLRRCTESVLRCWRTASSD